MACKNSLKEILSDLSLSYSKNIFSSSLSLISISFNLQALCISYLDISPSLVISNCLKAVLYYSISYLENIFSI